MQFIVFLFISASVFPHVANAAPEKNQNCGQHEHWVKSHHRNAYVRSDGTHVSATEVRAHCQADPPSYEAWSQKLDSGKPPGWEFPKESVRTWTDEEKERVLESLSVLPPELLAAGVKGIYRLTTSTLYQLNPAAGRNGEVALYDRAFFSDQNLTRILAHEFAHEVYRQMYGEDKGLSYASAADWLQVKNRKTGDLMLVPNRDGFVEEDGKENPNEDFSNNIEYFLFNPTVLKEKTLKVYHWILKKFGDKFKLGKES